MFLAKLFRYLRRLLTPCRVFYAGSTESLPPPLTPEEEADCLARLETEPDAVRPILIERNLRLVVFLSRKFENTGVSQEDLISIGTIGLIKAIGTYNPGRNIKLATYASRCIENEILMVLRKNTGLRREVSLDAPLNTDSEGNELLLSDILGTEPDEVIRPMEDAADRQLLYRAIGKLKPREQRLIAMRFGLLGQPERTQKEIADRMGISQSYISRLEKRILQRLRVEMRRSM